MKIRRKKMCGVDAVYHCMTRVVNGEHLFQSREKEMLRKMIWQIADFCGVEVVTYCVMSNHFHVLVRVPDDRKISDAELLRRYKVLYPKPTQYQQASAKVLQKQLHAGGEEAEAIRGKLLARMGDISEYMKALKQRFSIWYNRNHERYGTLWAERFKSVLVEGKGNALQTMAAYIDLNPVRAGIVEDPKDYRFCGYAEAVAGAKRMCKGLCIAWSGYLGKGKSRQDAYQAALEAHRNLIFGKRASEVGLSEMTRQDALKILNEQDGVLPKATVLRCRVRYMTDGAILGSEEFVRGFVSSWQKERGRKRPPKVNHLSGTDWGGLSVIKGLRREVFG